MAIAIDTDALSPLAAEIVELIGIDAALALFERFGGVRVYMPETVHADHTLARLLGREAAQALSGHYAREYLDVPKGASAMHAARNAAIIDEHRRGRSVRDLALRHHLTERRVYHILAASRTIGDSQRSLF